ncbi:DUF5677 domain-containing protein [Nocardioides sp. YJ-D4]
MVDTPFGAFEARRDLGSRYVDLEPTLDEELPGFGEAAGNVTLALFGLTAQVVGDQATHAAVRLLLNLAVNDFRDLLEDLKRGAGRSAMRTARSLIEHAINMHVIADDLAEASRYLEHLDRGPAILVELEPGFARIEKANKKAGSSYRHALRKYGAAANRRFAKAVAQHGPWFRNGWTTTKLRDRAVGSGLEHLYPYYQLASLVVHGSSGGALGTVRNHSDGRSTYRTGPALEIAPVAMWAGLAAFRDVLSGLRKARPDIDPALYSGDLDSLDALWVDYFLLLTRLDNELWPREGVRPPTTVLAFTQKRTRRWYLHIPSHGVLVQADEPVLPDWIEAQVDGMIDIMLAQEPQLFRSDQRWLTATVPHVGLKIRADSIAIPDTALLETPPEGWEIREIGRVERDR